MTKRRKKGAFPSAQEDARAAELYVESPQTLSPSYRLAYRDFDFLLRDELRPTRLQLTDDKDRTHSRTHLWQTILGPDHQL